MINLEGASAKLYSSSVISPQWRPQCGLHTNRALILALFLDSCTKWKKSSSVNFLSLLLPALSLYQSTSQTMWNRGNIAPLSSSHIYLLNSTGDKMGQHCIISVIQTGNDVSKTHGVTSSTIESRQHALPYNCFVLDLINSVVACRVHFLDFHRIRKKFARVWYHEFSFLHYLCFMWQSIFWGKSMDVSS